MSGYVRVSPAGSSVPLTANTIKAKGQVARAAQRGVILPSAPGAVTADPHAGHTVPKPR
jgi:hypothetical protein